jgi:hypothetical protein
MTLTPGLDAVASEKWCSPAGAQGRQSEGPSKSSGNPAQWRIKQAVVTPRLVAQHTGARLQHDPPTGRLEACLTPLYRYHC